MKPHSQRNCPTKVTLSAFVDSELSSKEQEAIRQHLTCCVNCCQIVEEMERLVRQLQSIPKERYGGTIIIPQQKNTYHQKWRIWQAVAAVGIIAIIISYVSYIQIFHDPIQAELVETYVVEHTMGQVLHVQSFGLYGN